MLDTEAVIAAILERLSDATVTVFGDYCLDAYWEIFDGTAELSLETGMPVRRVQTQRYSLGGAGSVVANLTALGVGRVFAIGVAGADVFGEKIRALLYAKPFYGLNEDSRIDFGTFNTLGRESSQELLGNLEKAAAQSDAVVLNQQVRGGLSSPALIQILNEIIAAHPDVIFLADSRHYPEF
jgi:bifunctional ADP-heptose synthase (sugar kinase/adenylyltransferase)